MVKQLEFCPKCNGNRKMILSLGLVPIETTEGREDILLYHYHCASCNSYVRSSTMEHEDFVIANEITVFPIPAYA